MDNTIQGRMMKEHGLDMKLKRTGAPSGEDQYKIVPPTYPIRRVCAWCKCVLGPPVGKSPVPGMISHGICPACEKKFYP